ncbi:15-hydroxyprostaglandin dehydrogenase [NAD(+)]-like [Lutzomyia longipalpis]|uniref:15-hydroxyprostaglandin dehydrogenase [NAD(+)]-like n=1 Tax=Lutzomyia longipalpis TaxID=7200 RepID=UPI002483A453|nr:15-hydroxyprostaglandin dehydrogenase [NAD(+)]-like [Lutzomyia longipalpis]
MSFANKSALVTGGTGAIGGAICEELLKNGVSYLAALDISSNEPPIVAQWRKSFPKASIRYFQVDVSSRKQLKKCYTDFTKNIPSLDIVINCAGIVDENNFRRTIEINLYGVMGSTMLAMDYMRKDQGHGKGGIILNVSSVAGLTPMSMIPFYCASKHAIIAFTRALSHDREYLGIKFLLLCPGGTQSQLYDILKDGTGFFMTTQEKIDALRNKFPTQSPAEVAKETIKLMQEGKSGSVWVVNEGKTTEVNLPAIVL